MSGLMKTDAALALADQPLRVFVMGCSRGGTTLTQRLIAERLGLSTLPETRFFASMAGTVEALMFPRTARIPSRRRHLTSQLRQALGRSTGMRLLDIPGVARIEGHKWGSFRRATAEFLALMDGLSRAEGRPGWLEKTPFHVLYAPLIARLVPGAWMIHILRDATETVGSIRDAARRYHDPWAINYDRVERDVDNWNASTAASAAMVGQPRQIFLPYAALTRTPGAVVDLVAERMGAAAVPPAQAASPAEASAGLTSARDQQWKQAAVSGVVAPSASKWATALTPDEQARAKALIEPVPAKLQREMARFFAVAGLAEKDNL
jgi:hypothetical protein